MLLLRPPGDCRSQRFQRCKGRFAEHAQQIHVRVFRNVVSRRRRSIKNHGQQILPRRSAHLFDELLNQFFRNHRNSRFLITAERPAPAGAPAAKSSKATAASTKATAAKSSSSKSPSTAAHVAKQHAP